MPSFISNPATTYCKRTRDPYLKVDHKIVSMLTISNERKGAHRRACDAALGQDDLGPDAVPFFATGLIVELVAPRTSVHDKPAAFR